jgi:transposase
VVKEAQGVGMRHSTKSYSDDLRQRVVDARLSGMLAVEVARLFQVSRDSVNRWVKQHATEGRVAPKRRGGYRPAKIADMAKFEAFAKAHAHSTLARMKAQWEGEVSQMCLSRALKRLGWTRKKNRRTTANATKKSAKRS